MTAPLNSAGVYGDFAGLEQLKRGARRNDASTLRQVAQQFESLFARMMIKSMRDAIGRDPIFGSDQAQAYQSMFDDQLSLELTRGKGLGLTNLLLRQLKQAGGAASTGGGASAAQPARAGDRGPLASASAGQADFVRAVWPQAQQAGRQLGVQPVSLIAQAALESNWGRSVPRTASGQSSHNLFGIKTGHAWGGAAVSSGTRESTGGTSVATRAVFRAYDSSEESFRDYVTLLRSNPRFSGALNRGDDAQAFASALQQAGYATDPEYAHKVTAIASQVVTALRRSANPAALKSGAQLPMTGSTDTL